MTRGLLLTVALAVVAFAFLHRTRVTSHRETAAAQASQAAPSNRNSKPLETISRPAKPIDVYFLAEAGSQLASRAHPTAHRQPAVNGKRRIGPASPITSKDDGHFISPRWSPDGLELLVSKPGFNGLYTVGANGGDIRQITDRENVGFGAKWTGQGEIESRANSGEKQTFHPDGTPADSISIEAEDSVVGPFTKDDRVYYRPNPGEAPVQLSGTDDRYYGGVVSPDGKHIVYNGLQTGLYIQPLDGSSPPVSLGEGYSPSWLPDSSGIVYNISEDDGHNLIASDLYLATADGQTVSNLTQTPDIIETNPSVSPDGALVAYEVDGVILVGTLH